MNDVLSKATQRPLYLLRGLGPQWPCSGVLRPPKPLWPPLDPPLRDGLRGGFLDLENGAIWPLNGLRAKKFHVFRIKGLDTDPWGGRVNARNENPSWQTGSFRSRRVRALFDRVTGPKRDPATETPFQSSGIQSHSSSKIPPRTCYQWPLPVAHKRIRTIRNHELSSCWVQRSAKKGNPTYGQACDRASQPPTPRKRRALQQWNG